MSWQSWMWISIIIVFVFVMITLIIVWIRIKKIRDENPIDTNKYIEDKTKEINNDLIKKNDDKTKK